MVEYAWYDNGKGRQVYRRVRKPRGGRSTLVTFAGGTLTDALQAIADATT